MIIMNTFIIICRSMNIHVHDKSCTCAPMKLITQLAGVPRTYWTRAHIVASSFIVGLCWITNGTFLHHYQSPGYMTIECYCWFSYLRGTAAFVFSFVRLWLHTINHHQPFKCHEASLAMKRIEHSTYWRSCQVECLFSHRRWKPTDKPVISWSTISNLSTRVVDCVSSTCAWDITVVEK